MLLFLIFVMVISFTSLSMKDMTQGPEGKLILLFTLPMLAGNVFQQMYNVTSSIIVGRFLGKTALGAMGSSFPIFFLMISLVMGITMGSTVVISQYYGAKDLQKVKRAINTTYIFIFFLSLLVTLIGVFFTGYLLRLIHAPADVVSQARAYLIVFFAGSIFLFGYNTISAILRGLGDSKTPLYFLIVSSLLNIALVFIFILVFKWGIRGAALATVISQGVSFFLAQIYLERVQHGIFKIRRSSLVFDWNIFKNVVKIGLPTAVQQVVLSTGMLAITRIVNEFGTDAIAAFAAAGSLDSFAMMPAMNFSMAISTFVGQNLGAGKTDRAIRGYHSTLKMSIPVVAFISVLLVLFRYPLIRMMNSDPEVIRIGAQYLLIICSFYVLLAFMFVNTGLLRGAGDTFIPMFFTLFSLWVIRIPLSAFLAKRMGTDGIWWAVPVAWFFGLTLSFIYYKTGRWKKMAIAKPLSSAQEPEEIANVLPNPSA